MQSRRNRLGASIGALIWAFFCALWLAGCSDNRPPSVPLGPPPTLDTRTLTALDPKIAQQLKESHARWLAAVDERLDLQHQLPAARQHGALALAFEQHALALDAFGWACPQTADPECHYLWGRALQASSRLDEARAQWREALHLAPEAAWLRLRLAELELDLGKHDAAAAVLGPSRRDASAAELGVRGRIALAAGEPETAADLLAAALELDPEASRLRYPLGLALRALGRETEAVAELARRGQRPPLVDDPWWAAVEALVDSPQALRSRAGDLALAGDHAAAAALFAESLALEDDPATRVNHAIALARAGQAAAAEREYRAALERDPSQVAGWFGLGTLLAASGRDEDAIEAYKAALALHPGANDTRFNLANAQRRSGRLTAAAENYREVIERDPARIDARLGLADTLTASGHWTEARQQLQDSLAVHPGEARIALELARLLAAAPEPMVRDGAVALRLASQLFERERSLGHGEVLAMALAENDRHAEAAQLQTELIRAAQTQGRTELLPGLTDVLNRYLDGKPWRLAPESDSD